MATIKGKWFFNEVLVLPEENVYAGNFDGTILFVSNGRGYTMIDVHPEDAPFPVTYYYDANDERDSPYGDFGERGWRNEAYRTIDFGETEWTVSDAFYEWLTANATKVLTIADKLAIITANEQKVYEAGLNKGGYADGYEDGYEDGKQAEYDKFWDVFQQNGKRNYYTSTFAYWNDDIYNPKYTLIVVNGNTAYYNATVTDTKVPVDITNVTTNGQVFYGATDLVTVRKLIVAETSPVSSGLFNGCKALENITIEGVIGKNFDIHWSKKLSADSIRNIIEHLSDNVSGKTLKLSETAVDTAIANGGFGGDTVYMTTDGAFGSYLLSNPIALSAGQTIKVTFDAEDDHTVNTNDDYTDWWIGLAGTDYTPYEPSGWTYTATQDEQVVIRWFFGSDLALSNIPIKIRAVLVDGNGNETGENLHSFATTTVPDSSRGTTLTIAEESWETLKASKPNWTISLV